MDRDLFEYVCVPLLGVRDTVCLGISTPAADDNYYSSLFQIPHPKGGRLFRVIPVGLACQRCRDAGVAPSCTHVLHLMPSRKSKAGLDLQKAILPEDRHRQENQAEVLDNRKRAFDPKDINSLYNRPRKIIQGGGNLKGTIFLAIDPSQGGQKSELAMIAGVLRKRIISWYVFSLL